jgi:predicted protein tyrosine phosphatase
MSKVDVKSTYELGRLMNVGNGHQGAYKRVLCVCTAGLLRSPTSAFVLSMEPFNFNTRCAGVDPTMALVPVDSVLLAWADEVVCMTAEHAGILSKMTDKPILCLGIPDDYAYRDPELMKMIGEKYTELSKLLKEE